MHILGEVPVKEGLMTTNGRVSYSPQEPWIFSDTVKENILFGENINAERYEKVIEVCGLLEASCTINYTDSHGTVSGYGR